jgi:hypothetical protein
VEEEEEEEEEEEDFLPLKMWFGSFAFSFATTKMLIRDYRN